MALSSLKDNCDKLFNLWGTPFKNRCNSYTLREVVMLSGDCYFSDVQRLFMVAQNECDRNGYDLKY